MSETSSTPLLKSITILTMYVIYLFDLAAIVIVFVIFSDLLINPTSSMVLPSMHLHTRNILLGLLYAAYPLTQFIGAPILGELSDRFGKKIILNLSTLGTVFSFFLTALSVFFHDLPLLFISRLIGGFFAGNASLAQATVSGLVEKKNRSRCMALFTIVGGFAWIAGPFLGSFLSNPNIISWFGYDVPFWFLGFVFLFCWGLILACFPALKAPPEKGKLSIVQSFQNLLLIFKIKIILLPFCASLISIFGWMMVQNFLAPFLMEKFSFSQHLVGYTYAYISTCWLCGGIASMFILKRLRPSQLIFPSTLISALAVFMYVLDPKPSFIYWAGATANFFYSISLSGFMAMFAHLLPQNMQGRLYGSWMGGFALASAMAPALAGFVASIGIDIPFLFAAVVLLISTSLYLGWFLKHSQQLKKQEA